MSAGSLRALDVVRDQIEAAVAASKCHSCGCLHKTVEALAGVPETAGLASLLAKARAISVPKKYDCLGCAICYPAIAANAFAEEFSEAGEGLDLCPTGEPESRAGWPPLPGEYRVARYRAPVAVCVLNTSSLVTSLAARAAEGLAIVGTLHTENLGIERVIRNVLANPNIRTLVLCGEDTERAVGHLPGQSLAALFDNGVDQRGRIVGAPGKRPVLKNVTAAQITAFREQVTLVRRIGLTEVVAVEQEIVNAAAAAPGQFSGAPEDVPMPTVLARTSRPLITDPAGYLVVYPDVRRALLVVEHYSNAGTLDCVVEGATPAAVSAELIERALISRMDHAAYLGRELARAERSLATGEPYVQDRAAGDSESEPSACGCGPKCQTETTPC